MYPLISQVETLYPTLTDEYMVNFIFTIRQMLWQIFSVAYEQSATDLYQEAALTAFLELSMSQWSAYPKYILKGLELFMCNSKMNPQLSAFLKSRADGMVPQLAMLYKTEEKALDVI